MLLAPPLTPLAQLDQTLQRQGHAVLDAAALMQALHTDERAMAAWAPHWDDLPPDEYLKDGGRYRRRRHTSFVIDERGAIVPVPHRAHWQPVEYNALHGGIERWFAPIAPALIADALWQRLLGWLGERASALRGYDVSAPGTPAASAPQGGAAAWGRPGGGPWYGEAHAFRIDTEGGIGRPTPEGAHRDGVDLVAVLLLARVHVKGGETRVFEAAGPQGLRFTMSAPWTLLLLDDARVIHETTPIQPDGPAPSHRDTLVVTLRAQGFQGP
jgi:hypothetical protein